MRIHIIKVLKYTNSILARFSSGPFLPPFPLSPPLVFGTKSERVCSIEWDHRERGMDRCCSECRALLSCRAVLPPTLPMPQKAKLFKQLLLLLFLRLRMLALGRESGGIGRESAGRSRGDFVYRGKDEGGRRTLQRKREGAREGPNVFALHEMKAQSFCGTDKRGFDGSSGGAILSLSSSATMKDPPVLDVLYRVEQKSSC